MKQEIAVYLASLRFFAMENYLGEIEERLEDLKMQGDAYIKEQKERLSSEDLDTLQSVHNFGLLLYREVYPRILYNSFLVSCFSLLERDVQYYCNRLKADKQIPISLGDLRGDSTLERSKLYFKLAGLPLSYDGVTWQELKHFYKVRNCIVHSNGRIPERLENDKDFMTYVRQENIVSPADIVGGQEQWEVALTGQFCRKVTKTMKDFVASVLCLVFLNTEVEGKPRHDQNTERSPKLR